MKTERIVLRASEEEKDAIARQASYAGMSISEYILYKTLDGTDVVQVSLDTLRELLGISR